MQNISIDLLIELIQESSIDVTSGQTQSSYRGSIEGWGDDHVYVSVVSATMLLDQLYQLKGE